MRVRRHTIPRKNVCPYWERRDPGRFPRRVESERWVCSGLPFASLSRPSMLSEQPCRSNIGSRDRQHGQHCLMSSVTKPLSGGVCRRVTGSSSIFPCYGSPAPFVHLVQLSFSAAMRFAGGGEGAVSECVCWMDRIGWEPSLLGAKKRVAGPQNGSSAAAVIVFWVSGRNC